MVDTTYVWANVIFPDCCIGCEVWLRAGPRALPLCQTCQRAHVPLPESERIVDGIHACHVYEGPLASALTQLKFGGDLSRAGALGRLLSASAAWSEPWDAVVPIPLHWTRLLARGFNQSRALVVHARRHCPAPPPLREAWLRRQRRTPPQHRLPVARRRTNLKGAFSCPVPDHVAGRHVLLVDDVVTTGATLRAASSALRAVGAARVGMLALLRSLA